MAGRRLSTVLEPLLYLGIAALVHSTLFLIPSWTPAKKDVATTQRGVRVKAFVERPAPVQSSSPVVPPPQPTPQKVSAPEMPPAAAEKNFSVMGSREANGESMVPSAQASGAKGSAKANVEAGGGGGASPAAKTQEGAPPQTEFGKYLASIRSSNVQGWAKESAMKSRQGWKGTGSGSGTGSGDGWGAGSGSGGGGRAGTGTGPGGSGTGGSGSGRGGDGAAAFMDPRVKMVVTSYPPTAIERKYAQIPYPNLKFKQSKFTAGWWNVYIKVRVDSNGEPSGMEVLRPETDGVLEKQFVAQVKREVEKWNFEPKSAEVHVDVRFYVE